MNRQEFIARGKVLLFFIGLLISFFYSGFLFLKEKVLGQSEVTGICGSADGVFYKSKPKTLLELCFQGKPNEVKAESDKGPWNWKCSEGNPLLVGSTSCRTKPSEDGKCGKANGGTFKSSLFLKPIVKKKDLCSIGTPSDFITFPDLTDKEHYPGSYIHWGWKCFGLGNPVGKTDYCGAYKLETEKTVSFSAQEKHPSGPFNNLSSLLVSTDNTIISNENDMPLGSGLDYFKINGTDVSVSDGLGGRKIPAGDLMTIPANTIVDFELGDKYCKGGTTIQLGKSLHNPESPFNCFFCQIDQVWDDNDTTPFTISFLDHCPCIANTFNNSFSSSVSTDSTIISIENDIFLGDSGYFKINGTDVSVSDGSGGKKIPAGHLMTIPANTTVDFEIEDTYCRTEELIIPMEYFPHDLNNPFDCFFCQSSS